MTNFANCQQADLFGKTRTFLVSRGFSGFTSTSTDSRFLFLRALVVGMTASSSQRQENTAKPTMFSFRHQSPATEARTCSSALELISRGLYRREFHLYCVKYLNSPKTRVLWWYVLHEKHKSNRNNKRLPCPPWACSRFVVAKTHRSFLLNSQSGESGKVRKSADNFFKSLEFTF